jgi:MFS family permease
MEFAAVQRRTLRLLFVTQIISGIGVAVGASVGALLAADLAGVGMSGLSATAVVVGAALFALPATAIVNRHGRRPSLALGYFVAAMGALLIVTAAVRGSIPLLFLGLVLFGGATAAGLQARYAAVDLAPAQLRGRHLSLIVWATTLGAVIGPSLVPVAGATVARYGVPTLAGPFLFSALLFGLATVLLLLFLRPDPAVVARAVTGHPSSPLSIAPRAGMRAALKFVASHPAARLGVSAMAMGNLVMVGVMAMTPVHIRGAGHDPAHTLRIVGLVLSFHVAGMFAFSPIFGWLTDRLGKREHLTRVEAPGGRRPVIFLGIALLLTACALAGTAGHDPSRLAGALTVLGLGWSATMVAGSTLLSDSIPVEMRPSAQGLSDLVMGLAGASAGAFSGVIVAEWGYSTLTLLAALATAPLILLLSLPGSRLESRARAGEAIEGER